MTHVDPFLLRDPQSASRAAEHQIHLIRRGVICLTDSRGFPEPHRRSPFEIVVDSSSGFVPLWDQGSTLRWRFKRRTLAPFQNPVAAAAAVRQLLGEAILLWGDSAPVRFAERRSAVDFEITFQPADDCQDGGCVLASAFFPDAGQHELKLYPRLFGEPRAEQVETLAHEIGHVFGLRHFFAQISEREWASEIFGTHQPFSIMNYNQNSRMTDADRGDLKRLYSLVWSRQLTAINGTPVRLFRPFSASRPV